MRLIGILGGMGPDAGIALSRNIVCNTIAKKDQDHLPQILCSLPEMIPDRTEYLTGKIKINPGYQISKILTRMESFGVTCAAMACNTAHAPEIFDVIISGLTKNSSKMNLLHMIEETGKFIKDHYGDRKCAGILGTTGTYITRQYDMIARYGLTVINIAEEQQEKLQKAIYDPGYGIKANAGKIPPETQQILNDSIMSLIERGAEIIVLGCTELPLVFSEARFHGIPVIDPSVVLARALIKAHSPEKLKPREE
ncbi:MAG: amino acid racemase [Prolixibacteraceae bacterium]|nr:amino acid racemase [Prolixibacteraceae bacterium]